MLPINYNLLVENFGVKYEVKDHYIHLKSPQGCHKLGSLNVHQHYLKVLLFQLSGTTLHA